MKIIHKIKLIGCRIKWYGELVLNSIRYKKEIKEVNFIHKKRRDLMLELLSEQRLVEDNKKIQELRAQISILNEILK